MPPHVEGKKWTVHHFHDEKEATRRRPHIVKSTKRGVTRYQTKIVEVVCEVQAGTRPDRRDQWKCVTDEQAANGRLSRASYMVFFHDSSIAFTSSPASVLLQEKKKKETVSSTPARTEKIITTRSTRNLVFNANLHFQPKIVKKNASGARFTRTYEKKGSIPPGNSWIHPLNQQERPNIRLCSSKLFQRPEWISSVDQSIWERKSNWQSRTYKRCPKKTGQFLQCLEMKRISRFDSKPTAESINVHHQKRSWMPGKTWRKALKT